MCKVCTLLVVLFFLLCSYTNQDIDYELNKTSQASIFKRNKKVSLKSSEGKACEYKASLIGSCNLSENSKINRFELVNRHNIIHSDIDPLNSLTVGNGEFAYTVDITGMQTFPEFYEKGIPLGTQSQWGWHSFPNPDDYTLSDVIKMYWAGNDSVPYIYQFTTANEERKNKASQWLRENPHRLHLGLIGLEIYANDTIPMAISDIEDPIQELNLWKGEIISKFKIEHTPVKVITYCHQDMDLISFRIASDILLTGKMKIKIRFPYATHEKFSTAYDLLRADKHTTAISEETRNSVLFERTLDNDRYYAHFNWSNKATIEKTENHEYYIVPVDNDTIFEFSCHFSKEKTDNRLPGFDQTKKNNEVRWKQFWNNGAAIDFSDCTDPRAFELERRVILSQYLTKIQCSGSLPPQETGLIYNSWYGKFHLEMHWWHSAHFILWNRADHMEQQMEFYNHIYKQAKGMAERQCYDGVRWPKMIGPEGRESPSTIGTFLIWQQPHIIYFSELLYNYYNQDQTVLQKYKSLVFATADFMTSYARMDSSKNRYVLGPALIPAQEHFEPENTINPIFELAYWYWALQTAQKWRERLNMERDKNWQNILEKLADLPVQDSLYLFTENTRDSYRNAEYLTDHPIVLGVLGFLPETKKIDKEILSNTLDKVLADWDWNTTWGWDFPLAAMCATQLNKPELAIDLLMMDSPKNTYLINGHNYQDEILTIYLPGNGGLLSAIALMCIRNGFPEDGKWEVKYENFLSIHLND